MADRPHRSVPKKNYRELADVKVLKRSRLSHPSSTSIGGERNDSSSDKLYRLRSIYLKAADTNHSKTETMTQTAMRTPTKV